MFYQYDKKRIGKILRICREIRKESVNKVAEASNGLFTAQFLSRIERGLNNITVEKAVWLMNYYNISFEELLGIQNKKYDYFEQLINPQNIENLNKIITLGIKTFIKQNSKYQDIPDIITKIYEKY